MVTNEIMINQIFNDDCLKILKKIDNRSIDLVVTSPPYCIGKAYDHHTTVDGFIEINKPIIALICDKIKEKGSICWQVGHHVDKGAIVPLDYIVYNLFNQYCPQLKLRNRIIWHFEHGANCRKRFSGRHETILWFTKNDDYYFDLDAVRVKQKYPGKKHYKGKNKGEYSCNPLGKNPGDVWVIPNVKANHVEKTEHPCQFPIALVQRLVKSLCPVDGVVLDPFMGSGSTMVASIIENRNYFGIELKKRYFDIAQERIQAAQNGSIRYRDINKPVFDPINAGSVAKDPFIEKR